MLAMDLGDTSLARSCAERAGAHPDALATLGALDLAGNNHAEARRKFERSLDIRSANPRAHIGLGLACLSAGQSGEALSAVVGRGEEDRVAFGVALGPVVADGEVGLAAVQGRPGRPV